MPTPPWYQDGLRFTCTQCGDCCRSHGDYQYVFLDADDVSRLAKHLGMTNVQFLRTHCDKDEDGLGHTLKWPDKACTFLGANGGCTVYDARPMQCRTWPFWPENLRKKVWKEEIAPFCPGADQPSGRLYSIGEIRRISKNQAETGELAKSPSRDQK